MRRQNSSFSIRSHTPYALGNNKFNSQLINSLPTESAFEMARNCHIYKHRVSKSRAEPFHMQLTASACSPHLLIQIPSEAVPAPLRSRAHGWSHPRTGVRGRASEQLHAHKQLLLAGWWRENTYETGAMLSQFKGLHHVAATFFPLRKTGAFPDTPFVFLYPNLQWSKNLIWWHPSQHSPYCLPQAPRSCWLSNTAHTGPGPAKHIFKFKPVKRFISFNGTIKRFKVKYIRNYFPESNPK